jgi:hypothetical protein
MTEVTLFEKSLKVRRIRSRGKMLAGELGHSATLHYGRNIPDPMRARIAGVLGESAYEVIAAGPTIDARRNPPFTQGDVFVVIELQQASGTYFLSTGAIETIGHLCRLHWFRRIERHAMAMPLFETLKAELDAIYSDIPF